MAILSRIIAPTSFLTAILIERRRAFLDLRWQSLIALLHLHLVSTRIWIERGAGLHGFVAMVFIS